jgi:hypothetical protein
VRMEKKMESAGKRYRPVAACYVCVHKLWGSTEGVGFNDRATADFCIRNIQRGLTWLNDSKTESDINKFILDKFNFVFK